ncbi:2-hydroxyhepta-2,4-diene-1, 7-dioate isomerase [Nitratireductor indicus C115]|uniref:2-hydroxyhepta-2,4-diene-1, 7-dioate isomerase n=1 Tax=Nitratireductor indicus C115 TaxID=1231190 RepID=K2MXS1_9HYPH|nr:fumarylacetoacetate hydrolase family protein [Nitratireductor indicus]EKF40038.1 2-hydroxyhepta-2,4-diene-1, 7-dioate isomerase [Nitratireductor indicus C115]SFQ80944.1 2-keto-4-pentenoate hydratase/2-oxohepta-3-ene-1,7-dioic acid hydratase (catechol pathway) [Nitratireductor indicus]
MSKYGRLASFTAAGRKRFGLVNDRGLVDLSGRTAGQWRDLQHAVCEGSLQELVERAAGLDADFALDEVRFDIPLAAPGKIICVGVNYPDRNEEYKDNQAAPTNPSLFIRLPGSFTGHQQPLMRPPESHQLDYEGELALVIGRPGRRIAEVDALDHIAAMTVCNEGTIRDWVRHAKFNVTQGKNFDASGAMGPWIVPYVEESQIADVALATRVNGETRQSDRTGRMIFSFRRLINYISTFTTLQPGDVIVTGTPTGAGARFDPPIWLEPGDVVEVEVEGIGLLRNTVADEVA